MDEEMLQDLGIVIHSSDEEVCKAIFSPALPPSPEDNSSGGEVCNAFLSPTLSSSSDDVFWESDNIARHFRDYMDQSTNIFGKSTFLEWPDCNCDWDPYWGIQTMMTSLDRAEAVTITVHSRAATDTEILMTEFIACFLTADIAWCYDSDYQGPKRWWKPVKQPGNVTEDNMLGFKSPMQGLPIRLVSIHGQDIRILTTYFTKEYYQSFQKGNQSTSSNLDVLIESFRLPDDWEHDKIKELLKASPWLQKQMRTSNEKWTAAFTRSRIQVGQARAQDGDAATTRELGGR